MPPLSPSSSSPSSSPSPASSSPAPPSSTAAGSVAILPGAAGFPTRSVLSDRVHRVLGLNPSTFTGPGTNTYLIGMGGEAPLLLDTGSGVPAYLDLLQAHLQEHGKRRIERVVLTHAHPDHIGGVAGVLSRFPQVPLHKFPYSPFDGEHSPRVVPLAEGDTLSGAGYTLRALHTPGHAPDHLCFYLEEEQALFSGDVILGVGTTVIPQEGGNLVSYLHSLERLLELPLQRIYPAHGPVIAEGRQKVLAYIEHRRERERQIVRALQAGCHTVPALVQKIYAAYPQHLHAAAAQSVRAHLDKLIDEGRVTRTNDERFQCLQATEPSA